MTKHKDKVSWIVLGLIAALTLASILNIIQKSASYHSGFSAKLIGIGFGLSLATTVYVVMLANTAKTRWTAASFAAVFALVSATIQTAMYLDEHAPLGVALAYGAGVPGFEAALAILEAMLRREVATEGRDLEIERLRSEVAREREGRGEERGALERQIEGLRQQLVDAAMRRQKPAPVAQVDDHQSERQPRATLTPKQIAKMQEVAKVAGENGFATDAQLADILAWSETTARRYRTFAEEQGLIAVNGDGKYHPVA